MVQAPSPQALDRVAAAVLDEVKDGMVLGLGTGRAAEAFVRKLGAKVRDGLCVRGVTTSVRTEKLAKELGIPLATLDEVDTLDLAVDGADEVDPQLDLTKGLGGALLRERVVAAAARRFVVLVTPEKRVPKLGTKAPVPVEVVPFARRPVMAALSKLGGRPVVRTRDDGGFFVTDNGNLIVDFHTSPIDEPAKVHGAIRAIAGVVDTGLFLELADRVIVGSETEIEILEAKR